MALKQKQWRLIWVLLAISITSLGVWGLLGIFSEQIRFFYAPSDLLANKAKQGEKIRAGGLVKADSISKDGLNTSFIITDGKHDVTVLHHGLLPQLFRESQGIVAEGRWDGSKLEADNVLTKHDENYMPPEVAKALKDQGMWKGEAGENINHQHLYKP